MRIQYLLALMFKHDCCGRNEPVVLDTISSGNPQTDEVIPQTGHRSVSSMNGQPAGLSCLTDCPENIIRYYVKTNMSESVNIS